MTVLVTGGAGYIGSHMVWNLLDAGERVVVLDRLSTGFAWAVAPGAKLVVGDVGDMALVTRLIREEGVEAILHFAGSVVVPESVADPLSYYDNNTARSRNLLEAAIRCGIRHFVFSSTAAVYAANDGDPVREDAPLYPASPYGWSKLMVEHMLRDAAAAHDFTYTALRYFNVAGADPAMRTGQSTAGATHLLKVACETATGTRPVMQVFGTDYPTRDGSCIRDLIHVSDLVQAHSLALTRMRAGGNSLVANLGYGNGYSVLETIDSVRRTSGVEFPVEYAPRRPGDLQAVVADASRARSEFGWQPKHEDLDGIVRDALEWERRLSKRRKIDTGSAGIEMPDDGGLVLAGKRDSVRQF
ncbi:MAG: UDP-glucose 4-epimerase GalE [Notoacmeibacter sp.]|nr:UDP-glucose 4-epimerase GalE [Notoacmeibacter sp.]